jgi:hypothetical protein
MKGLDCSNPPLSSKQSTAMVFAVGEEIENEPPSRWRLLFLYTPKGDILGTVNTDYGAFG